MGTTADKLNYLNETKSLFKDNLNGIGAEITDETTFKEYPDYLENLYNDISEKTNITENGIIGRTEQEVIQREVGIENTETKIYINDVDNTKENYITLKGNTYQYTTTGKNLLETRNVSTTLNGITCSYNQNTQVYTFNGTCDTNNTLFRFSNNDINFVAGTTKSITYWVGGSVTNYCTVRHYDINYSDNNIYSIVDISSSNNKISQTSSSTFVAAKETGTIRFNNGSVANNLQIKIMVTNDESTDYEPYTGGQPSPNPDYPQEIKNVNGENKIKIIGKNLFGGFTFTKIRNGITYTYNKDGSITANGTSDSSGNAYSMTSSEARNNNFLITLEAGTYTLSGGNGEVSIELTDSTGANIAAVRSNETFKTFTLSSSVQCFIRLLTPPSTTISNLTTYQMLEKNSTVSEYEPYISRTFPVNLKSKNLFDKDNTNKINGYLNNNIISSSNNAKTIFIPCKSDTTYTVSKISSARFIVAYSTDEPIIGTAIRGNISHNTATEITITTDSTANYLAMYYYTSTYDTLTEQQILDSIQIEENDHATDYESYYDIELSKIGDYQDYLYKSNGKWYKYSAISKVVLNGSESWNSYSASSNYVFFINNSIYHLGSESDNPILSDKFKAEFSNNNGNIYLSGTDNRIAICTNLANTVSNWKTWLSSNNTTCYFALATPISTEIMNETLISQLNALYTAQLNNGINNINTITNNLLPYINMKYNVVTPSPSPDRPSEIKNLNGELSYKIQNKNLYNKNIYTNGTYLNENGLEVSNVNWMISDYIPVEQNEKYHYQGLTNVGTAPYSAYYDSNKNFISSFKQAINENIISIPNQVYYVRFSINISSGLTDRTNFIINKGDTYISRIFPINLKSKNLFDDVWEVGGIGTSTGQNIENNSYRRTKDYTSVLPNTNYTFSIYQSEAQIVVFYYNEESFINFKNVENTSYINFTTPNNCNYIRVRVQTTNLISSTQLELGDTPTSYMPYTEPYDIQLCKQSAYQDFIKRGTGKNLFDNTIIRKEQGNYLNTNDTVINTGKRLTYNDTGSGTWAIFLVYSIMDLTNYVGKTIKFKSDFVASSSNKGRFYIGLCNNDGSNRTALSTVTTSGEIASFVVPSLTDEQTYLCLVLYANHSGTVFQNDYVDYTNMILTIDDEDMTYEPYGHQFYLHKDIGDIVLDGSEDWERAGGQKTILLKKRKIPNFLSTPAETNILFNYFRISNTTVNIDGKQGQVYIGNNDVNINYDNGVSTVAQFKTWLSMHNTIMQYVLQTPTTEVISEENYPVLYKQLSDIQDYLTQYKIDKEFILEYDEPSIEY